VSAAIAAAAVLGGLLLLLAVPVAVAFEAAGVEPFNARLTVRWLFGLVRFRIRVPESTARRKRKPQPRAAPVKRRRRGDFLRVLRDADFRRRVQRLATDLLAAAHLNGFGLRMRLGLGDPAETGIAWALLGPLNAAVRNLKDSDVSIEPEFIDAVFEFDAHGRCWFVPLRILALAVAFSLSAPAIRAWRTLRSANA
jgi:hypothetical protein